MPGLGSNPMPATTPPRVVIVGGGFGGLYAARALRRAPVEVTLLDRRNYHLFQPLLYQVATAALNPSDIAAPIRRVLRRQPNARVLLAEATAIDLARKCVVLADGAVPYDYLVLATGATHSYFGHDEYARFAPGLKSIEDALEMRRRVLLAYEAAERATDPAVRQAWLTFVVVGGGPTGVELAGALAEIARHALHDDFRTIDPSAARVVLVMGARAVREQDGKPVTGLAAVAVQEGPHAARNILHAVRAEPLEPFHYTDKGILATIGRAAAVASFGRVKVSGLVAWLLWLFVHIFLLIGFRNRFVVMFSWAWTYFTYERGARLITGEVAPVVAARQVDAKGGDEAVA